jgi:uncharacterized protein (TIGR03067 family)
MATGQGPLITAIPAKVVALTEGVLKAMLLTRLKTLGTALVAGLFLLSASAWAYQTLTPEKREGHPSGKDGPPALASQRHPGIRAKTLAPDRGGKKSKTDQEQFQGKWRLVKAERYGMTWVVKPNGDLECEDKTPKAFPIDLQVPRQVVFSGNKLVQEFPKDENSTLVERSTFRLDPSKKPKWITQSWKGEKDCHGIYAFERGTLRICWNYEFGKLRDGRPSSFDTEKNRKGGMDTVVWFLERQKK